MKYEIGRKYSELFLKILNYTLNYLEENSLDYKKPGTDFWSIYNCINDLKEINGYNYADTKRFEFDTVIIYSLHLSNLQLMFNLFVINNDYFHDDRESTLELFKIIEHCIEEDI